MSIEQEIATAFARLTEKAKLNEQALRMFNDAFINLKLTQKDFAAAIEDYNMVMNKLLAMPLIEVNEDTEV
jgi:hypothetical protein